MPQLRSVRGTGFESAEARLGVKSFCGLKTILSSFLLVAVCCVDEILGLNLTLHIMIIF